MKKAICTTLLAATFFSLVCVASSVIAAPLGSISGTDTVQIAGAISTSEIYAYMHEGGPGANATKVEFTADSSVTTEQTGPQNAPFANTSIQTFTDNGHAITFSAEGGLTPSLAYWFYHCSAMTSCSFSGFNTTNVTSFASMFESCLSVSELDFTNFDTYAATTVERMLYGCSALETCKMYGWRFNPDVLLSSKEFLYGCSPSSFGELNVVNPWYGFPLYGFSFTVGFYTISSPNGMVFYADYILPDKFPTDNPENPGNDCWFDPAMQQYVYPEYSTLTGDKTGVKFLLIMQMEEVGVTE